MKYLIAAALMALLILAVAATYPEDFWGVALFCLWLFGPVSALVALLAAWLLWCADRRLRKYQPIEEKANGPS